KRRSTAVTLRTSRVFASAQDHVGRAGRRYVLDATVSERRQVEPGEQGFPGAQQQRRDGELQLVDRPRAQVLPQRRDTAADAHVPALRGLERERPRALEAVGDERKGRAAAHGQRRTCIVREDEDRAAERRLVAPPTGPALVGPGPADGAEHVAAENPGTDPVKAACDEVVVDAGLAALRAENALAKSARRHRPVVK